jgi:BarA-like signal transduction histidine kinase
VADEQRTRRLRAAVLALPAETLRTAVRGIGEDMIRALPGHARPLANQLKRAPNPSDLLRRLPNLQVVALVADQVSDEPLEVTRAVLGDAADDPTREQLLEALAKALELFDVTTVRVMLATVALADAEAADLCDELLTTDERFVLDVEPEATAAARPAKEGPSLEVLAARKARKDAERKQKQARKH